MGHRKEASVAHQARIAERCLDVVGQAFETGVVVGRSNDAGVQQPRGAKIMDKRESAGHAPAHVERLEPFRIRRPPATPRRQRVDGARNGRAVDEFREGDRPVGRAGTHHGVPGLQFRGIDAQAPRGPPEKLAAKGGGGEAQRLARVLQRTAARRIAFVRRQARDDRRHENPVEGHPQFARHDERHRGVDPLPDLHLSRAHLHAAIRAHGNPVLDIRMGRETRVARHRPFSAASARTARRTLGWAPQRHRCGASAARIAFSSGRGSPRSRPVIATTSPGVQ